MCVTPLFDNVNYIIIVVLTHGWTTITIFRTLFKN